MGDWRNLPNVISTEFRQCQWAFELGKCSTNIVKLKKGGSEPVQRKKSEMAKNFLDKWYNYKIKGIYKSSMEKVNNIV